MFLPLFYIFLLAWMLYRWWQEWDVTVHGLRWHTRQESCSIWGNLAGVIHWILPSAVVWWIKCTQFMYKLCWCVVLWVYVRSVFVNKCMFFKDDISGSEKIIPRFATNRKDLQNITHIVFGLLMFKSKAEEHNCGSIHEGYILPAIYCQS